MALKKQLKTAYRGSLFVTARAVVICFCNTMQKRRSFDVPPLLFGRSLSFGQNSTLPSAGTQSKISAVSLLHPNQQESGAIELLGVGQHCTESLNYPNFRINRARINEVFLYLSSVLYTCSSHCCQPSQNHLMLHACLIVCSAISVQFVQHLMWKIVQLTRVELKRFYHI